MKLVSIKFYNKIKTKQKKVLAFGYWNTDKFELYNIKQSMYQIENLKIIICLNV